MKVLACPDDQFDAGAGTCAQQVWIDQEPSIWSGWTASDLHALAAGLLAVWAVALIFRTVHKHAGEMS